MTLRSPEERAARELLRQTHKAKAPKVKAEPKARGKWARPVLPPRVKLSPEQKARCHGAHAGLCWLCDQPVPVDGPEVQYDHKLERWEKVDDSLENIGPAHTVPCHARKSAQKTAERAHNDRMARKHAGEDLRKGPKIQSRGFEAEYTPLPPSRGFRS